MSMTLQERQCLCELNQRVTALEEGGPGPSPGGGGGDTISLASGYTGGGPSNLDGTTTVGVTTPAIYSFKHSTSGWRRYILRAGTDAESAPVAGVAPTIIRPDDYAASTNEKVFELMV